MSTPLLSALAKLDDSIRVLEGRLDCLGAGLEVSREQFIQNLTEARQNADAVQNLVREKRPDVDWADRQSLEGIIRELEVAETGNKDLCLRKLLELADELNAGTISHRLKSRVTALEGLREAAVSELLSEAAQEQPKDIPGPNASAWLPWACRLQENANAEQFSELERDLPALVRFVGEMEESYWQPRGSAQHIPEQAAVDETLSASEATTPSLSAQFLASARAHAVLQQEPSQLSVAAPAFAAKYGHLSAAKVGDAENASQTDTVAADVAQPANATAPEVPASATADSNSDVARILAAVAAHRMVRGGSIEVSKQSAAEDSANPVEPTPPEPKEIVFRPYLTDDVESGDGERKSFRSGTRTSVFIAVGAIVTIIVVLVGMSAVNGNLIRKHGSSPATTAASDSAKETSGAAPVTPLSDIELVGQIEQRLKSIEGGSIYVTVQHGTAILEGKVPSEPDLAAAEELTLQSSQIKVVRDRLQIEKTTALHSASRPTKPDTSNEQ